MNKKLVVAMALVFGAAGLMLAQAVKAQDATMDNSATNTDNAMMNSDNSMMNNADNSMMNNADNSTMNNAAY